jgi:alpha-ketoglutarate-dependent taurine dioxygenase
MHIGYVEGVPEAEGKAMIDDLLARATVPANVYRHAWQPGDLVMWDNRCLLHRADRNYDMAAHPRVLHRTVVRGTVPV